jgi:AcrR family transcriptional regulator
MASAKKKDGEDRKEPVEDATRRSQSVQAVRSQRTRTALLAAAETIFARDGFEASRIEDIAAEAGRSRGAFYANFENKTEVFLALRSLAARRRARAVKERIQGITGYAERYAAIHSYLLEEIHDHETLLLQIEFKLFALRHPELLEVLAARHLEASTTVNMEELPELHPAGASDLREMRRKTLAIEAILEGFALNALFGPKVLDRKYLQQVIPKLVRDIAPLPS